MFVALSRVQPLVFEDLNFVFHFSNFQFNFKVQSYFVFITFNLFKSIFSFAFS